MKLTLQERRKLAMAGKYHELFERAEVTPLDFAGPINGAFTPSGDYNPDDESLDDCLPDDIGIFQGDED